MFGSNCIRVCAIAVLVLSLDGCGAAGRRKEYDYNPPTTFDEHPWGQRIDEFDHLELISSCRLDYVSCTTAQPSELTAYIRRPQSFHYPGGVEITSMAYIFCYSGITVQFCGSVVHYESEEFELANHQETWDGLTNNERLLRVLTKSYGLPSRGTLINTQVKVYDSHNNFVVPKGLKSQRYSWCGLGDPHVPRDCPITVVMYFDPVLGHGHVLYATPLLQGAVREWQQYDLYPSVIYEDLYQFAKPKGMPVPVACHASTAAERTDPASGLGLLGKSHLFSEMMLDIQARRRDETRDDPIRRLSASVWFEQNQYVNAQLNKYTEDGGRQAYWFGYSAGASHTYFGGHTDTEDAHAKWLQANQASESYVRLFGLGYRDGIRFDPHPPKTVAPLSPEQIEVEEIELRHLQDMVKSAGALPLRPADGLEPTPNVDPAPE